MMNGCGWGSHAADRRPGKPRAWSDAGTDRAAVLEYYRTRHHSFLCAVLKSARHGRDRRDLIPLIKAGAEQIRPAGRAAE